MAETKKELLTEIKKVVLEISDLLLKKQFEEAGDLVNKLDKLLKSDEVNKLTMQEARSVSYDELVDFVKKYKYWIREFRKSQGALLKKGERLPSFVGA